MSDIVIKGKIVYQALGTGFWGIEGEGGEQWRPTNLPSDLCKEGTRVKGKAKLAPQQISIFMWGKTVELTHVEKG